MFRYRHCRDVPVSVAPMSTGTAAAQHTFTIQREIQVETSNGSRARRNLSLARAHFLHSANVLLFIQFHEKSSLPMLLHPLCKYSGCVAHIACEHVSVLVPLRMNLKYARCKCKWLFFSASCAACYKERITNISSGSVEHKSMHCGRWEMRIDLLRLIR